MRLAVVNFIVENDKSEIKILKIGHLKNTKRCEVIIRIDLHT